MSESIELLRGKIAHAGTLGSVVRTMKTLAAVNIRQYEEAVRALGDYYHTVELGLFGCLHLTENGHSAFRHEKRSEALTIAIVFGSDQGLVGQFNDLIAETFQREHVTIPGAIAVIPVGERVQSRLEEGAIRAETLFALPNSVSAITPLVGDLLSEVERLREKTPSITLRLYHNSPVSGEQYRPVSKQLLPFDQTWATEIAIRIGKWPTRSKPEILNGVESLQWALIREYLFVSLYRACAESLAAENASRLSAMQRAEKNIDDMLETLTRLYNERRQAGIDEELFDVVSGFQSLGDNSDFNS
ncbi:MAG: F0F1 ATP synthase subunit gamma [Chlorobaculum sp.]|jgi:F-type H+-transporting ATPase subunit gamma|nr:F0F1 ATP synthase subunit gamma [Chlorobaculum sp.]